MKKLHWKLTNHIFKQYEEENGKRSFLANEARLLKRMSVKEFETYRNGEMPDYFYINALMHLQDDGFDHDKRNWYLLIETKDIFLEVEIDEDKVIGGYSVTEPGGEVVECDLNDFHRSEMKDFLKNWLIDADEEARHSTGDPYKDYAGHSTFMPPSWMR